MAVRRRIIVLTSLAAVAAYVVAVAALRSSSGHVIFPPESRDPTPPEWPAEFLWGAATASHQIEGGNTHNDWARFESVPGHIRNGERSGRASGHWERVAQDIGLLTAAGANAYRFSVEWSRVEPREGIWDESAWAHYVDEVGQLRAAGIMPMVTLLHFTLPDWIAQRGGAAAQDFPERFGRYAAEAARRLGDNVDLWCTVNEPNVQMYQGYVIGVWPPGVKDHRLAAQAFAGLLRAHAAAVAAIRRVDSHASIGAAVNVVQFEPAWRWSLVGWLLAGKVADGFNWAFYNSIAAGRIQFNLPGFPSIDEALPGLQGSIDWVGLNYYRRNLVQLSLNAPGLLQLQPGPGPRTDTGIEIHPEGLLLLMREAWAKYHLPIYITENGIADSAGTQRAMFIRTHAYAVQQAQREGIPVGGFFYWSLMDNFEWAEGFGPRFGLYRVDYETLGRAPTPGVAEFRRLAPRVVASPATPPLR